jgi:predicted DNA-binding protein
MKIKPPHKKGGHNVSFCMNDALKAKLQALSKKLGYSQAEIVRQAVENFLSTSKS